MEINAATTVLQVSKSQNIKIYSWNYVTVPYIFEVPDAGTRRVWLSEFFGVGVSEFCSKEEFHF